MLLLLARVVAGRRSKWLVLAAWGAVLMAAGPFAAKLPEVRDSVIATAGELPASTESRRLAEVLRSDFASGETFTVVLAYRREGGLRPADRARIVADAARAARVGSVLRPVAPFGPRAGPRQVSRDGAVAFTVVPLTAAVADDRTEAIERLREFVCCARGGLEARVTGPAALQSDTTNAVESADATLLGTTALLVLVLLVTIYRSPLVAFVPLGVVGVSLVIAIGLIYLFSTATDRHVETTTVAVLAVLLFGAGTDYCLLLVARYTAELQRTRDEHEAMAVAAPRAAPAILASGATVAGAMLVLQAADTITVRNAAPVYAIGVAVVLLASLTLLPSVLVVMGRRGFWPSRARVEHRPEEDRSASGVLPVLGAPGALGRGLVATGSLPALVLPPGAAPEHPAVGRGPRAGLRGLPERLLARPGLAIVACVALLAACTAGLAAFTIDVDQADDFRGSTEASEGVDLLASGFAPGALNPTTVLLRRDDGPVRAGDVAAVAERVRGVEGVAAVEGPTDRSRDGRAATLSVVFADDPGADRALDRVETLRGKVDGVAPGVSALVGLGSAARLDYRESVAADVRLVVPLVLLVISAALVVLLRAIVAPLYLLGTVLLSFVATFGLSMFLFEAVLGQDSTDPGVVLLCFLFLVALGVDYNIFLMSDVRDEARAHDMRSAVLRALSATGPVITSAGLVLAGTFAVLMTLPLWHMLHIGFVVAFGVLVDTFLVRTILVPALAVKVGDRSWWPSRMRRAAPPGREPVGAGAAGPRP